MSIVKCIVDSEDSKCFKLGVREDATNRTKIAELMGWRATKSGDGHISLTGHSDRMKDGQNDIHFHWQVNHGGVLVAGLGELAQGGFGGDVHDGPRK